MIWGTTNLRNMQIFIGENLCELNIYPQIALLSFFQNQKALQMLNNNNKTYKLENFRDVICH